MSKLNAGDICLYHMPFCPLSRKLVFGLQEKGIPFQERLEKSWAPSPALLSLNPTGEIPVMTHGTLVCANEYIAWEYIEDVFSSPSFRGETPAQNLETRHWVSWFDRLFYQDIYLSLFYERALKRHLKKEGPNTTALKSGRALLRDYLKALEYITEAQSYLCSQGFSWADITGACHLSCIDYLGDVPWRDFPFTKEWYLKIKSRPSFRPFLSQTFPGLTPAPHYSQLDF